MRTGSVVIPPPHKLKEGDKDMWLECYPTIEECKEFNKIPLKDRTYCETIGRHSQSPRLVRVSVAKEKGLME